MKAMIFAAGLGTRFKPWTDTNPKALAMVNGKSLLQRNVELLQRHGIRDVIINVHHFPEQIIKAVQENKGWGSTITISDETDEVLETGGGLLKAKELLAGTEPFITLNADILTDLDLTNLVSYHKSKHALVTLAVSTRKTSRYFLMDDANSLCGWRNINTGEEKIVVQKEGLVQKAYSGIAVFQPDIFEYILQRGKFSLTETYLSLASTQPILGFDHSGDKFVDVGKPESVAIAEALFS